MSPLIPLILNAGPSLLRMIGKAKGGKTESVIEKVVEVVEVVKGKSKAEQSLALDSVLNELPQDVMSDVQYELALINEQQESQKMLLEDRQSARDAYKVHNEQADKIAERIMKWNLPYIAFVLIVNVLCVVFITNSPVLAAVNTVFGMVIKSLFDERQNVSGFYFGSSMGSKQKDVKK